MGFNASTPGMPIFELPNSAAIAQTRGSKSQRSPLLPYHR
jgi:hypothetical protein